MISERPAPWCASRVVIHYFLPLLMLTASTTAMTATPNPLSKHQWNQRPLLIFFATENNDKLQRLRQTLSERRCDVAERDMVIIEVPGEARTGDGLPEEAAELRRRFDVENDAFTVILVGKDGGEKIRLRDVPDLDVVFSLIDGMPMRQREMQEKERACQQ